MPVDFTQLNASLLPPNATSYNLRSSVPPLHISLSIWALWSSLSLVSSLFALLIITAVIASRRARQSGFNVYLAGLLVPDAVAGFAFCITCWRNLAAKRFVSEAECSWQSGYLTFSFVSSYWMIAIVAFELAAYLRSVRRLCRVEHIPAVRAIKRCVAVYLLAAFIASWTSWGVLPTSAVLFRGLVCIPAETSRTSRIFSTSVYVPIAYALPLVLFICVGLRVKYEGLLKLPALRARLHTSALPSVMNRTHSNGKVQHRTGRISTSTSEDSWDNFEHARAMAMYFARLFLTLLWWVPFTVLTSSRSHSVVPLAVAFSLVPLGTVIVTALSLTKDDVREAVRSLITGGGRVAPHLVDDSTSSALSMGRGSSSTIVKPTAASPS